MRAPDAQDGAAAAAGAAPPWRRAFAGLFAASLLAMLAIGVPLPVLPRYVTGPLDGGDLAVGVVIGAFAATAIVARPWAGRAADARGRRAVLVAGALLMAVAGGVYALPLGVPGLVLARLVLGAGEAMVFTAGASWAVELAPAARRGQLIGIYGITIWGGIALGTPVGEALRTTLGFGAVWAAAAVLPLAGALLARRLPDPPVAPLLERPAPAPLLPREALRPGLALCLGSMGFVGLQGFGILHLEEQGLAHGAAAGVFTAFAASVVGSRLLVGRTPDRLGALPSAMLAGAAEVVGLLLLAAASSLPVALAGAVLLGVGFSLLYPSLALLVVNRADERRRGQTLGTFTAFFDLGMGVWGATTGLVASLAGYPSVFWVAAGAAVLGVAVAASARDRPGPAHGSVPLPG